MNQEKVAGKDFVVVDVRKLDHTVRATTDFVYHVAWCLMKNRVASSTDRSIYPLRACTQHFQLYMLCSEVLGSKQ